MSIRKVIRAVTAAVLAAGTGAAVASPAHAADPPTWGFYNRLDIPANATVTLGGINNNYIVAGTVNERAVAWNSDLDMIPLVEIEGHPISWAHDINDRDDIVGAAGAHGSTPRAYVWRRNGEVKPLGGDRTCYASAISGDGDFGGSCGSNVAGWRPVRFRANGTIEAFTTAKGVVNDISNDGVAVGKVRGGAGEASVHGYAYGRPAGGDTGAIKLDPAPFGESAAVGITADGETIVGTVGGRAKKWVYDDNGPEEPAWLPIDLGPYRPGWDTTVAGISDDGSHIVGTAKASVNRIGWVYVPAHGFIMLAGEDAIPVAVNNDGAVVGMVTNHFGKRVPVIWYRNRQP